MPIAYSRKFNGLFSTLGYSWMVDGKQMTTDEAFGVICAGFGQRQALAELLIKGNLIASTTLLRYESFLAEAFNAISVKKITNLE